MVDVINIALKSRDGITLNTKGTYCDKNIQIIPQLEGDCSGNHIIDVDELPEVGEEGAIYRIQSFDVVVCIADFWIKLVTDYLKPFGVSSGSYIIPTETTAGIKTSDYETSFHFYYIEDSDGVFTYDGNSWVSLANTEGSTYGGIISDISEATDSDCHYALIEAILYRYINNKWVIYNHPVGSLEITKSGTYDVSNFANVIVNTLEPIIVKTADNLPETSSENQVAIVTHGISSLTGVGIPIDWGIEVEDNSVYHDSKGNIYFSHQMSGVGRHYVFDKEARTWQGKTSFGSIAMYGEYVWNDSQGHAYYSATSSSWGGEYKLNEETDTWEEITWNIPIGYGTWVWSDGTSTYFQSYVLNEEKLEWESISTNLAVSGEYVWHDNDGNTYYSKGTTHYKWNKETLQWEDVEWLGLTDFNGSGVWTDGVNMFYNDEYVLDGNIWNPKKWNLPSLYGCIYGDSVWSDGEYTYLSSYTTNGTPSGHCSQHILAPNAELYVYAYGEWREVGDIGEALSSPSGSLTITQNDTVDVTNYAQVVVNVPPPDGWIKPDGTLDIFENGDGIDVASYESVNVKVPPLPIEISNDTEMTDLLETAPVGSVYKFIGVSEIYKTNTLYIVAEEGE